MLQLQLYCMVAPPTAWKHTQCSLWRCGPVKTIFIKCLKELKRLLSENTEKAFKPQGAWISDGFPLLSELQRQAEVPHEWHCTSCNPRSNFSSPKNFWSQWTKQTTCTLVLIHCGKLRQRALIRHPPGAGLNFLSQRHLTSASIRTSCKKEIIAQ